MELAALFALSYGLYVVSSYKGPKLNGQIANAVMQVTDSPVRVACAINKKEFTHGLIEVSRALTVTVFSEEAPMDFIARFGFQSGRDVEKFDGIPYAITDSGCPYPTQYALAMMDMRVADAADAGSHTIFLNDVVDARLLGEGVPMTYSFYREVLRGKTPPTAPTYRAAAAARSVEAAKERSSGVSVPEAGTVAIPGEASQKYVCNACGYVYDPAFGDPENGVAAGTAFADLPEDWCCPRCGAGKEDFVPE